MTLALSLLAVLSLVVPARADKVLASPAPDSVRLILNWKPEPQFGGFYEAREKGFFAEHALKVEILEGGAGTPSAQMVASGRAEFGIVSADELLLSRAAGTDLVALYAVFQRSPHAIMTHEARGFKTMKDVFAGEGTLAVQKGLPYVEFLLRKYPNPKVQIVPYQGGITQFLADAKHSQQCFITSETQEAERRGRKTVSFLVADEGFDPYLTVVVASRKYIERNPQIIDRFVSAIRKGWVGFLKSPDATNAVMARLNPSLNASTFQKIAAAERRFIETSDTQKLGLGTMSEARWQGVADELLKLKLIKNPVDVKSVLRADGKSSTSPTK